MRRAAALLVAATALAGVPASAGQAPGNGYAVPFSLALGKQAYDRHCAECHGAWADGSAEGPPLVHVYYEPGHHGDRAFYAAITGGVRQHHWEFGDMAPVPDVSNDAARAIVRYVRWLQEQNGIR